MDLVADQIAVENAAQAEAETLAIREMHEQIKAGNIDKLPKAKLLIGNLFPAVHQHLVDEQARTVRGVGANVRGWLRSIPADVAAVLAMRACMKITLGVDERDGADPTVQRISMRIARDWVQEIQVRQAMEVNPVYYQAAMRGLERANVSSQKHISMTVNRVVRNTLAGLYDNDLSATDLLQLGKHGLQACMNAGLVEQRRSTGSCGHIVTYHIPEALMKFLGNEAYTMQMASPMRAPMLSPPLPWSALAGGGFLTERAQIRNPLLDWRKKRRKGREAQFHASASVEQMPAVYQYVNYVQGIPFEIHAGVFEHIKRIWGNGGGALGMPTTSPPVKPAFPLPAEWKKDTGTEQELEVFARWKYETTRWHEACQVHKSAVWDVASFMRQTRDRGNKPMYYPVFLDSRGRLYYRCNPTPQGSDMAKAAIQFHRKKPLGERGIFWLKVHIANCFGHDDGPFTERAQWTESVWERLQGALAAPEYSGVFEDADNPLCALAAAMDLSAAYASGNPEGFLCGIPIHMDATCSGLQHFSAMLRDEVGGQYVNLVPGGARKADIYRRVADLAAEDMRRMASTGNVQALEWVTLGVDRKLAKPPTMTYVYGATLMSIKATVINWMLEHGWAKEGLTLDGMALFMAKVLLKAVERTVPAAAAVMRWLKAQIGDLPRYEPVEWCTPLGVPVVHDYREEERTRVRLRACDMEYVVMYRKLDKMDLVGSKNAISPNFVHGLDGTHLGMTALRMEAGGRDMVCIHDSFGTHPCDVDAMHSDIREAFIWLYSRDVLNDWANQLGLEVTYNSTGKLDLAGIRQSEFFFC